MFPVVKKPLNIVGEGMTYLDGTASASVRLLHAMRNGLDKFGPAQADAVMRQPFPKGFLVCPIRPS